MTKKERIEYNKEIKRMKDYVKKISSSSKEESIKFLQDAGICDASGKHLTKHFK
jgi:hypothetical protein